MTTELTPIDPSRGDELFRDQVGERRIPFDDLVAMDRNGVALFTGAIKRYMETHPRLEVSFTHALVEDVLVVRWRWRSGS